MNYEDDDDDDLTEIEQDEDVMNDAAHEAKIVDGHTYIGLPIHDPDNGLLFGCHVSAKSFCKYDMETVCDFLKDWSCSDYVSDSQSPEIMKLIFTESKTHPGCTLYSIVLKTHWLRLIQRTWRKTLENRKKWIYGITSPKNRTVWETTGHHLPEYRAMPKLRGCMSNYKCIRKTT
jgi:hypothetical protein